jgi:hypothetical protein
MFCNKLMCLTFLQKKKCTHNFYLITLKSYDKILCTNYVYHGKVIRITRHQLKKLST